MIQKLNPSHFKDIRNIFWQTSSKNDFKDHREKEQFQNKYLEYYVNHKNSIGLVYIKDSKILGYILGISLFDQSIIEINPIYQDFLDEISVDMGELHINLHPNSQGLGIGSMLISAFEDHLAKSGCRFSFLITHHQAKNYMFYMKNQYQEIKRNSNGVVLLTKRLSV